MKRVTGHEGEPERPAKTSPRPAGSWSEEAGSPATIVSFQQAAGNQAVASAMRGATIPVQRQGDSDGSQGLREMADVRERQREEAESWARTTAGAVAFDLKRTLAGGYAPGGSLQPVLTLMSGHDAATRAAIQTEYSALDGDLRGRLKDYYYGHGDVDGLVKAWALLSAPHYHDYHVAVALALIPPDTRDKELYRLLTAAAKGGNQKVLREAYDKTFAGLGQGTLRADLEGDLGDLDLKRANALMDHPLSEAERLYLNLYGLKEEGVKAIGLIERAWKAGPREFHNLKEDWDYLVVGKNGWTGLSLKGAFEAKLPGWFTHEELLAARDIYFAYELFCQGLSADQLAAYLERPGDGQPGKPIPWEEQDWILQAQIFAEERLFRLADPETGAAADENRYFASMEKIQTLTQQRIAMATAAGQTAYAATLEDNWQATKQGLLASAGKAFDAGSDEDIRARLLAEGNLTLGDKAWIRWKDGDGPGIIALTTQAWAAGEVQALINSCGAPRAVAPGLIRPGVPPLVTLVRGGLFGEDGERVRTLAEPGDDVTRGRNRLAYELDPNRGRGDRNVAGAYDFLTTTGIKPDLRDAVIAAFVSRNVPPSLFRSAAEFGAAVFLDIELPASPVESFLDYLAETYPNSNTVWNFYDLLAPTQDINEIVRRAEKRTAIATTGFSAGLAELFDVGGEDTLATTKESLARLQYLQAQGLNPDDVALLLAVMGKQTTGDLAGVEYDLLKERVDDLLAARKQAVGTFVTLVEFAVQIFLNTVTLGAPLIAELGATLAGILVQEAIEGDESDALTQENLLKFVTPVIGVYTGKIGDALGDAAFWGGEGTVKALLKGASANVVDQAGEKIVGLIFDPKWPTAAEMATMLITSTSGAGAGQAAGRIKGNIGAADDYLRRAELIVKSKMYGNVISAAGGMVAKVGTGAMDDKSIWEIGALFGEGLALAQAKSLAGGLAEARMSLVKQRQLDEFNAAVPTAAGSPLAGRTSFSEAHDPSRDKSVPLGSGEARVVMQADGDSEIHVDTPHGRRALRDVLVDIRPPATADEASRLKWVMLANRVVNLEARAKDMDEDQISRELFSITWTVVSDFDPARGSGHTIAPAIKWL